LAREGSAALGQQFEVLVSHNFTVKKGRLVESRAGKLSIRSAG
jgi:hypothetical protein